MNTDTFCAAKWPGVDYLTDGKRVLFVLGWSDYRHVLRVGDVQYRLLDLVTDQRCDMPQNALVAAGFDAALKTDPLVVAACNISKKRLADALAR